MKPFIEAAGGMILPAICYAKEEGWYIGRLSLQ